jgi:hypothetical protein
MTCTKFYHATIYIDAMVLKSPQCPSARLQNRHSAHYSAPARALCNAGVQLRDSSFTKEDVMRDRLCKASSRSYCFLLLCLPLHPIQGEGEGAGLHTSPRSRAWRVQGFGI